MEELATFEDSDLESLKYLPEKYRQIFPEGFSLNQIQSQALPYIFNFNNSFVLAAPTGSGKTIVLELAIIKLLSDLENSNFNNFKIVYICPVKALCRERYFDWNSRFEKLGVSCTEITGDGGDYADLQDYDLIITTPEKWDSMTRKWKDNASLVKLVKLFLMDEVHLLSDNKRGPVLEAIVCRMKTISKCLKIECLRFVAISATIYNIEDLATWLGTKESPASYLKFGNEVRPVQLQKIVKGYPRTPNKNAFLFDIQLSYKLKAIILEFANGKPSLIFCSTRKSVIQTAKILSLQLTFHFTETQYKNIYEEAVLLQDNKLKDLILTGIGYHHAGMSLTDRHRVHNLFVTAKLPILVATSTLAMGVNLPAHLVVIKSTQQYKAGQVMEYPESSVLQMIGRAGRPQFDTSAVAVVMTTKEMVQKYERMLDSKEFLESSLHLQLPEYLNSEIVLRTITDLGVAMEWISNTFLYVRAMKNPKYYGFDSNSTSFKIEKSLETMCLKEINGLKKAQLIEVNENGMDISPTSYGKLMSHFYLSFNTFKIFLQLKGTETVADILAALSESHEFSEIHLRVNERRSLNELNRKKTFDHIRYPIQGKIKTKAMKVNCLIQACLGCLTIPDPALYQESVHIVKIAERLAKCLSEFLSKKPYFQSILSSVLLAKCLHAKLWEDSLYLTRQIDRIGPALGSMLAACGKTSFHTIETSNPRELERLVNRAPPFGNYLVEAVQHLPKYKLTIDFYKNDPVKLRLIVTVSLFNSDNIKVKNTAGNHHWAVLIVGDTNNKLLNYNRFSDSLLLRQDIQIIVPLKEDNLPHKIIAHVISEQWVGIDVYKELCLVVPSESVPATTFAPVKKKRKIEEFKKPNIPKVFEFFNEYKNKKTDNASKDDYDFVACFDIDIEIIQEQPKVKDMASIPVISKPILDENTSTSILNIEKSSPTNPLLSLENIYESLMINRPTFKNEMLSTLQSEYFSAIDKKWY